MAGLKEIQAQQERWNAEGKGTGTGDFYQLFTKRDDIVFHHFMSTGEDGDPYFEVYFAHEVPAAKEGAYATFKYCPVESGHDLNYACKYCDAGIKTKKRMAMWLYVGDWLHAAPGQNQFQPISYNGRQYFLETVNEPKLWETSAWRESCLTDIIFQGASMGNLHNARFQLLTVNDGRDRRYKMVAQFGSPAFDHGLYAEAKQKCKPIIQWLRESIAEVATAGPTDAPVYQPAPATQHTASAPQQEYQSPPAATQPTMMRQPAPAQEYRPDASTAPVQEYKPEAAPASAGPPVAEPWETGDKVDAAAGPLPDLAQPAPPPNAKALF